MKVMTHTVRKCVCVGWTYGVCVSVYFELILILGLWLIAAIISMRSMSTKTDAHGDERVDLRSAFW